MAAAVTAAAAAGGKGGGATPTGWQFGGGEAALKQIQPQGFATFGRQKGFIKKHILSGLKKSFWVKFWNGLTWVICTSFWVVKKAEMSLVMPGNPLLPEVLS